MSENIAVIPKGTKIQIMGCSFTLLEDVKVIGNQMNLDKIIEDQIKFDGEVRIHSTPCMPSGKSGGVVGRAKNIGWMF
ncbi:hypothetical protein EXE10_20475 [Acinetobacter sp. WCHAc060033]|uniref:hypothetical protein n=1 Tax=Acinetobacter sp. WCHAc060033 TaxID=2518624 RepID=UPI001023BD2E|nr:hypothetical protein [Acinetobacter sp. WCHAc060033]RZG74700.1 hypothetical protein EXE10_20475 [Acinetobacter sp. WCHAc060033]